MPFQRVCDWWNACMAGCGLSPGSRLSECFAREVRDSPLQLFECRSDRNSGGTAEFIRPEVFTSGCFLFQGVMLMRCPFCGSFMENGFLQGGSLMVWVKKKHHISLLPREGEVMLDRNYWTSTSIPAHICKQCKKVIAEYEEESNSEF